MIRLRGVVAGVCAGVLVCSVAGLTVMATAGAASALPSNCSGTTTITCTFAYTGSAQTWTVPAGVSSVSFLLDGAAGRDFHLGADDFGDGGLGGTASGTIAVVGGSVVTVNVGGAGDSGGFNGGAFFGGGGASDVRVGGTTLADRVLVAGGGGGSAAACGGARPCTVGGAGGGTSGGDGTTNLGTGAGGEGGTQIAGGDGHGGGSDGQPGLGGSSGSGSFGGGGGGGYFGGGGGGDGNPGYGAGGGGSGYFSPDTSVVTDGSTTAGTHAGNGQVTLTYATPATTTTVTSSTNPSTFGNPVTFTATVSPTDGGGTVGFFADGSATAISGCDAVPLVLVSGSYQAACNAGSSMSGGNHPIHAAYTGTPGYAPSSGDLAGGQQVTKATQRLTFPGLRSRSIVESPFTLNGVTGGGSGQPVTFTASGGKCTVTGSQVKLTHAGTCTITAHQAGNTNYQAAPNVSRSFTVTAKPALRIGDANTTEGGSGTHTMVLGVSMNKAVSVPVTVAWTTANGSATAPGDYLSGSGTLTFAPGQTTRTITTTVKGDHTKEPSEVFFVLIHQPHNATITDPNASAGIINDDH